MTFTVATKRYCSQPWSTAWCLIQSHFQLTCSLPAEPSWPVMPLKASCHKTAMVSKWDCHRSWVRTLTIMSRHLGHDIGVITRYNKAAVQLWLSKCDIVMSVALRRNKHTCCIFIIRSNIPTIICYTQTGERRLLFTKRKLAELF